MFRVGGDAGGRRRRNRSQMLFVLPVAFGAAAFLAALSSGSGAGSAPATRASSVAMAPAAAGAPGAGAAAADTAAPVPPAPTPAPGQAADVTGTAAPAPTPTPAAEPDRTLPANPALRSLEARVEYDRRQTAAALQQLAARTGLSGSVSPAASGHAGGSNPELLPDLRPLAAGPAAEASGRPILTPDPLNPVWDSFQGPFREQIDEPDHSNEASPPYTEAERAQLAEEGRELFFSTTAWGQKPSQGVNVTGEFLSCASCHSGPGFTDNRTHIVGPVREREFGHRQTPALFGIEFTAPYMWDGRNATLQNQARGAITSPLEMHSSREPTRRELDALVEFQIRFVKSPPAVPGKDFDPVRAARGEQLFRTPRDNVDPTGEFAPGEKVACATCHTGAFFTDGKAHRGALPTVFVGDAFFDPGRVGSDGNIEGFDTPSLLGVRFSSPFFHDGLAGDPTAPSNFLGGGLGVGALDGEVGATGPAAARRALLNNVLPFYNSVRFNFGFTQEELADLAEFLLSL